MGADGCGHEADGYWLGAFGELHILGVHASNPLRCQCRIELSFFVRLESCDVKGPLHHALLDDFSKVHQAFAQVLGSPIAIISRCDNDKAQWLSEKNFAPPIIIIGIDIFLNITGIRN